MRFTVLAVFAILVCASSIAIRADDDQPLEGFWQELDSTQQRAFEDTLRTRIYDSMRRWWEFMQPEDQHRVIAHYRIVFETPSLTDTMMIQRIMGARDLRVARFYAIESGVVWREASLFGLPEDFHLIDASSEIEFPYVELCMYLKPTASLRVRCN